MTYMNVCDFSTLIMLLYYVTHIGDIQRTIFYAEHYTKAVVVMSLTYFVYM